jgi:hypothetical protein
MIYFVRCHAALNKYRVTFQTRETAAETYKRVETFYGNKASSSKHVFEEFKDSKADIEETEGDTKRGQLSAVQSLGIIAKLCELIVTELTNDTQSGSTAH